MSPASVSSARLSLVVAACNNSGIGIKEKLPWRLKGDVAFFRKLTLKTEDTNKCNAVIMGRKTWDSIPVKFRPLVNRVNIVISRNLPLDSALSETGDVQVARGLDEAVELLTNEKREEEQRPLVENIFIIGGSSIYEMALSSPLFYRLYLTRVLKDFHCDAFLPHIDYSCLQEVHVPDIASELLEDNGIEYRFCIYEKIQSNGSCDGSSSEQVKQSSLSSQEKSVSTGSLPIYVSAAVDESFGFGKNGKLPWSLRTEYDHFISMVTETADPDKKIVFIKGRRTFEDTTSHELQHPKVINIVVSKSMLASGDDRSAYAHEVVDSLDSAVEVARSLHRNGSIEKVWIMGGLSLFKECIDSVLCDQIYLTHVKASYDCDLFFPSFKHGFREIREKHVECRDCETGVEMTYCVYERIPKQLNN